MTYSIEESKGSSTSLCNDELNSKCDYLPYKIIRLDPMKNIFTLEEVIYGKSSIDSLLHLFEYEDYKQCKEEEITSTDRQLVRELFEKFKLKLNE
jgi:hypothetical protein